MNNHLKIPEETNLKFKQLKKNVEKIKSRDPENHKELFNDNFMKKHTKFKNAKEFLNSSPFNIRNFKELKHISKEK